MPLMFMIKWMDDVGLESEYISSVLNKILSVCPAASWNNDDNGEDEPKI